MTDHALSNRLRRATVAMALAIALSAAGTTVVAGPQQPARYAMRGMVLKIDPAARTVVISHDSIPGVMPAMTMPFEVRALTDLAGIAPGMTVQFTLVLGEEAAWVERLSAVRYESVEQDPLTARRLRTLRSLATSATTAVAVGQPVPNFTLTDQTGARVTLSGLRGKVVALNFIYTSCALPQFCFRVANYFGAVQKRFSDRLGRDLVLLTVTFDPARDTPQALAEYASQWNADPASWHFLTGKVPEVRHVCGLFGVDFFPDEGLMSHSSHTVIIDRQGRLHADIEGSQYTAAQLGDLVATALVR